MESSPAPSGNVAEVIEYVHRHNRSATRYRLRLDGPELRVIRLGEYDSTDSRPEFVAPAMVFPLREAIELWLMPHPLCDLNRRFLCRVTFRNGYVVRITNRDYENPEGPNDRSAEFRTFVRALSAGMVAQNPTARFTTGWRTLPLILLGGGLAVLFVALVNFLFYADVIDSLWILPAGLAAIGLFHGLVTWAKLVRPSRFQPDAIPEKLLPRERAQRSVAQ